MRLNLAKYITLEHIEPIGRSAGALGRRGAAETSDRVRTETSSNNLKGSSFSVYQVPVLVPVLRVGLGSYQGTVCSVFNESG